MLFGSRVAPLSAAGPSAGVDSLGSEATISGSSQGVQWPPPGTAHKQAGAQPCMAGHALPLQHPCPGEGPPSARLLPACRSAWSVGAAAVRRALLAARSLASSAARGGPCAAAAAPPSMAPVSS
uniref:Uncharacterized protein n=1 Tax=Pyrodinium bahamense TaxID=73915 RepID=A0A7S0A8J1_9DINO